MEACWITAQQETEGCEVTWIERVRAKKDGVALVGKANGETRNGTKVTVCDDGFRIHPPHGCEVKYSWEAAICLRDALNELLPVEESR